MKKNLKRLAGALSIVALGMAIGGCTPKNITYMQDVEEVVTVENIQKQALKIQPDDKLSIIVHSKDPELAALFNLPVVTGSANALVTNSAATTARRTYTTNQGISSYTVTPEGTIDFPVLGTLKVKGLTRSELAEFIKGELIGRDLIKDPTVIVEFLNVGFSILGEVRNPGRYDINRDNFSVLDAVSYAGDLTIQGKRENVRVIRQNPDGKMQVYTLDLTNSQHMLESPGYFLQQNDVIYVEPSDLKKRETTVNGNSALSTSFWISAASLLTSIAVLVVNIVNK